MSREDVDGAIEEFRKALSWDPKLAEAHLKLGELYMREGTPAGRIKAEREMRRALKLDRSNPRYHLTYGLLKLRQGFLHNAEAEFKKALELDPNCPEAYYNLGLICQEQMLRHRDMIDGPIRFREFAEEDGSKAIDSFRRALDIEQNHRDALFHLGLVYLERGEMERMVELYQQILENDPNDKDAHLFLGLAYYRQGHGEQAWDEYEAAKSLMEEEERAVFESIEPLLSPKQGEQYADASTRERKELMNRFWLKQDPLYLTDYNERILEHYSRVAYANLRFGSPEKGIEGWRTDQGKVYIRYGAPLSRIRTRPWIEAGGGNPVHTSVEVWRYRDFDLAFEDMFLTGQYRFKWGTEPETDGLHQYTSLIEEAPQIFEYDYAGERFDIPHLLADFRGDGGRTAVDVCYALPAQYLDYTVERDKSRIFAEVGVFFFDSGWNSVAKSIGDEELVTGRIDPTQEHYVTAQQTLQIKPGAYHFALEVRDKRSNNIGLLRDTVSVDGYDSKDLQLSDILFASDIGPATEASSFRKGDVQIAPNPRKTYPRTRPMYIYYEIYNLLMDGFGRTHYQIECTVGPEVEERRGFSKLLARLGGLVGIRRREGEITVTSENRGRSHTEYEHLRIDISNVPLGTNKLTLRVRDLNSNQEATVKDWYVIVEWEQGRE